MIVELRQYTLRPGRRDELIELFDREFVESQEQLGMMVLGQFRDLDRPDRFVWLRGFADMTARRKGLQDFYSGPVWAEHGPAANATMIDSDDVLLLRAITAPPQRSRDTIQGGLLYVTAWFRDHRFDPEFADRVPGAVAAFTTEYAVNDFPALPIREGEHVLVWITRDPVDVTAPDGVRVERLRLSPTSRSALRG
ncbi:NIPSNAP family protein [Actinoplanes derwentensis]|uniref:NIPSNAP protein n=1 Tax=Actinoplanes derwentensis TaxID=113562 RepID=A0A1H1TZN4_9ACTN|nr:NIPSNAP family protein [Actinoplanes derwentensis]GID89895.1 NIPSNAP family protein [Actinoplanes derwentensis]SDS65531.1 NIPSNAP protein [Actinoplanes derwentensis]